MSPIIREQPSVHVSVDVRTQRSFNNEEISERDRDAFEHDRSKQIKEANPNAGWDNKTALSYF